MRVNKRNIILKMQCPEKMKISTTGTVVALAALVQILHTWSMILHWLFVATFETLPYFRYSKTQTVPCRVGPPCELHIMALYEQSVKRWKRAIIKKTYKCIQIINITLRLNIFFFSKENDVKPRIYAWHNRKKRCKQEEKGSS